MKREIKKKVDWIMAKSSIIAEYIKTSTSNEVKLRIYENKDCFRGTLLDSYGHKIDGVITREDSYEDAVEEIKEHFNFNDNNSYCILSGY